MTQDTFLEHVSNHYKRNLPFVAYRKPNSIVVKAMLQNDNALHVTSNFIKSGFVFAPFDSRQHAILIPIDNSNTIQSEFTMLSESVTSHTINLLIENDKDQHINLVKEGIKTIRETNLVKVVLSRKEVVQLSENNPIEIFKRLLSNYASAFVYCWYHPNIGLWLGATPETLIKIEGNRFSTMSLAGTQLFNGTTDVKWSNKEVEEQQIVTKSIVKKLNKKVHEISVSNPVTVKAGNLLHIQTKISGIILDKLEEINLKLLFEGLHPTPAVCGSPQEEAKQFILENENYHREFYTGFLGELNLKQKMGRHTNKRNVENNAYNVIKNCSNLYVNLRCMKLKNDEAELFVGGGITKDSIAELEWQETVNKTKTIKRAIVF